MAKEMTEFNNRLDKLAEYCMNSGRFDQDLYIEYDVKRGLRDSNGKGILTGLTGISDVVAFKSVHGRKIPIDGQLYYQGTECHHDECTPEECSDTLFLR